MAQKTVILDQFARPFERANGHAPKRINGAAANGTKPRVQLLQAFGTTPFGGNRRLRARYDAAEDRDETRNHWLNADGLDADSANNKAKRHKLMFRSRYEHGSNGFYAGILRTHCNMLVGVGPTLRMLTKSRKFNKRVEKDWFDWCERVQFNRKLWCMCHARYQDGEAFSVLQTNPKFEGVQLDFQLFEAEQCQTPFPPFMQSGYIDGIRFDEFNNILWYDVLPYHPGAGSVWLNTDPIKVPPENMLHWFKMERPGEHRSVPDCTPSLNVGAGSRRFREATLGSAETAAEHSVLLKTGFEPEEVDEVDPMMQFEIQKRMMTALPIGWDAFQMRAEHPNAQYPDFHRCQIAELGRPISQPVNLGMCDSSTYSFASGKLDTLGYKSELNVERGDCNTLALNPLFAMWFREWTLIRGIRRTGIPDHQWDWPAHPIIDVEAEARAADQQLKNGRLSLRTYHSDGGSDYDDELEIQAEDAFGEASKENVDKIRKINVLRNTPAHCVNYVADLLGIKQPAKPQSQPTSARIVATMSELADEVRTLRTRFEREVVRR